MKRKIFLPIILTSLLLALFTIGVHGTPPCWDILIITLSGSFISVELFSAAVFKCGSFIE